MNSQHLPRILSCLQAKTPRAHDASFRIAPDTCGGWRLFDGSRALAHFAPAYLDIWAFSPFEPDIMANPVRSETVLDLHTAHNTWINFGAHGWPARWKAAAEKNPKTWTWEQDSGPELRVRVALDGGEGEGAEWLIAVSYDPARAQYRYTVDVHARKRDLDGLECLNLMAAGALVDRPERRRWSHSVSENAAGVLRRVIHSNALYFADGVTLVRSTTHPSTWVAYAAHADFNPAILVHSSNVQLYFATCDQLFDEHLIWRPAGQDEYEADGMFHYRLSAEIVNIPSSLAVDLLESATDPVPHIGANAKNVALPFRMGQVNSFEEPADQWQPVECPLLVVPVASDGAISWANGVAHTGVRSIRLKGDGSRNELFPLGAVCSVEPHRRYRLSGWVRTRGVAGEVRLELDSYSYTYSNVAVRAESAPLSGDCEWTQLEVGLDSGDFAYVLPRLVIDGTGEAWFDDVQLGPA